MRLLTITTTPQDIIVQSVCQRVLVKEDESIVASSGGTAFVITKGGGGVQNVIQAGKFYDFPSPGPHRPWQPGEVVGQIFLGVGSTSAIQDESP